MIKIFTFLDDVNDKKYSQNTNIKIFDFRRITSATHPVLKLKLTVFTVFPCKVCSTGTSIGCNAILTAAAIQAWFR